MGTQALPQKGGGAPQIFGPYLLWPNGWMDQDGTWHGGRPQPRRLCVRWVPTPPQFSAHFYCGQTAGCIKMPLCMEVGLIPGDFVRWWPSPFPKRGRSPQFSTHVYYGQTAAWITMSLGMKLGLDVGDVVLDGDPVAPSPKGGGRIPKIFGPRLLWPNGCLLAKLLKKYS